MTLTPKPYPRHPAPVGHPLSARPGMLMRMVPQSPRLTIAILPVLAAITLGALVWQHAEQLAAVVELAVFVAASGRFANVVGAHGVLRFLAGAQG